MSDELRVMIMMIVKEVYSIEKNIKSFIDLNNSEFTKSELFRFHHFNFLG